MGANSETGSESSNEGRSSTSSEGSPTNVSAIVHAPSNRSLGSVDVPGAGQKVDVELAKTCMRNKIRVCTAPAYRARLPQEGEGDLSAGRQGIIMKLDLQEEGERALSLKPLSPSNHSQRDRSALIIHHSARAAQDDRTYRASKGTILYPRVVATRTNSPGRAPTGYVCDVLWAHGKAFRGYCIGFRGFLDLEIAPAKTRSGEQLSTGAMQQHAQHAQPLTPTGSDRSLGEGQDISAEGSKAGGVPESPTGASAPAEIGVTVGYLHSAPTVSHEGGKHIWSCSGPMSYDK